MALAYTLIFLLAVMIAVLLGRLPSALLYLVLGMSLVSFLAYGWDKRAAQRAGQRTPEATLLGFDLLGGWPGGLFAQRVFRHKTRKVSFQRRYWLAVSLHSLAVAALVFTRPLA